MDLEYEPLKQTTESVVLDGGGVTELKFSPKETEDEKPKSVSEFRVVFPQILASTAKNMILLDLGMTLAFPTIVIPALLSSKEGLQFTKEQASWFGSIAYICQPAGSLVSGLLFEPLGRKRAMLLVNLPHIVAWLMMHFATSITELYVAGVIMGLGVGFMEAPIITYVGEISQPKWRGILTSYAGIFVTLGYCLVFFLGTITDWQLAAAICAGVPILSIIVISQVPESPIWLIARGRLKEAEKSLCWLRGWVAPELVKEEFNELCQHNHKPDLEKTDGQESFKNIPENSTELQIQSSIVKDGVLPQSRPSRRIRKILAVFHLDELYRRQTLQPLLMVIVFFFFHHASGISSTRPFLVEIFNELGSPLDAHLTTVVTSIVGIIGNVIGMIAVMRIGKKTLSLYSMAFCATVNVGLCIFVFVPKETESWGWVPITLYVFLTFGWSCGVGQVPWMLLSEVFPFRGRGVASGVAAAASYVLGFIVTKTYFDLHDFLSLPGVFGLYGAFCIVGCVYFYYFLPETEGKSLEEIEVILEEKFLALRGKLSKSPT